MFKRRSAETVKPQEAKFKKPNRLTTLTGLNLVGLLLLWIIENFIGEWRWLPSLLLYMPQQVFVIPTVLLLLHAVLQKQGKVALANLCIFSFSLLYLLGLNVPLRSQNNVAGTSLRVMTYNIEHGMVSIEGAVRVVRRVRPDVLSLQEANAKWGRPDPMPKLRKLLPGWHLSRYGELVTFSRHPIIAQQKHRLPIRTGCGVLETQLNVKGQRLTVFNVHFGIPIGGATGSDLGPAKVRSRAIERKHQTAVLLRAVRGATTPFLIMGDFNNPPRCTPNTRQLRALTRFPVKT